MGQLRLELQSITASPRTVACEGAGEEIERLRRRMGELEHEIRELTQARQQADDTIAALQVAGAAVVLESRGLACDHRESARTGRCGAALAMADNAPPVNRLPNLTHHRRPILTPSSDGFGR
jgi:hypothetical protein